MDKFATGADVTRGTLAFIPVAEDDNKELTCAAFLPDEDNDVEGAEAVNESDLARVTDTIRLSIHCEFMIFYLFCYSDASSLPRKKKQVSFNSFRKP